MKSPNEPPNPLTPRQRLWLEHIKAGERSGLSLRAYANFTKREEALLDEFLAGRTDAKDILGEHGLVKMLTKQFVLRT